MIYAILIFIITITMNIEPQDAIEMNNVSIPFEKPTDKDSLTIDCVPNALNKQLGLSLDIHRYRIKSKEYSKVIKENSIKYNLPVHLIEAVIQYESSWKENSTKDNCNGLMAIRFGSFDPIQNIKSGCAMLAGKIKHYHTIAKGLSAYNGSYTGRESNAYSEHIIRIWLFMEMLNK